MVIKYIICSWWDLLTNLCVYIYIYTVGMHHIAGKGRTTSFFGCSRLWPKIHMMHEGTWSKQRLRSKPHSEHPMKPVDVWICWNWDLAFPCNPWVHDIPRLSPRCTTLALRVGSTAFLITSAPATSSCWLLACELSLRLAKTMGGPYWTPPNQANQESSASGPRWS